MVTLVLVRHGESIANAKNIFTGWNDISLSKRGIDEAKVAGELIKDIPDFTP
ncbi:phosphoglycerate mutase, partial [Veillonellaceae bacterium M2-4]|nr:phosphoglycerate mutase [Veillonellaceae bacterium M2-4]